VTVPLIVFFLFRGKARPYREAIIGPGGPLHLAVLDVEGEILHGDVAGGLEHPVRQPHHLPEQELCHYFTQKPTADTFHHISEFTT